MNTHIVDTAHTMMANFNMPFTRSRKQRHAKPPNDIPPASPTTITAPEMVTCICQEFHWYICLELFVHRFVSLVVRVYYSV